MSAQSETTAGASADVNPVVPMTRREALARERAAQHAAATPEATPAPAPSVAPAAAAASSRHRAQRSRPERRREWQPKPQVQRETVVAAKKSWIPGRVVRTVSGVGLVAGLFATVAVPAYSLADHGQSFSASDMFSSSRLLAQSVSVSGTTNGQSASTDGYSSESGAQIVAAQTLASRTSGGYIPTTRSPGDDYPWWNYATESYGGGLSPLGYYYRECVDFVAWRLNRDAGAYGSPWKWVWNNLASGSAYVWYSAWRSHGWQTSSTPVAGAVAWFTYNHVAYVNSVNADGSVNIEEYNWEGNHAYNARTIQASDAIYLYPPS